MKTLVSFASRKPYKLTRREMTFLEVLIGLSLTLIILSTLFFFYRQVIEINTQVDKMQNKIFEKSYIEMHLAKVFSHTLAPSHEHFYFFTSSFGEEESLVFSYYNGAVLDKNFSNEVLGRLYVDKKGQLILATWPSPKRWKMGEIPPIKKEILMTQVTGLSFEFYVPPEREWSRFTKMKSFIRPAGEWHREWAKDYMQLPAMIKIHVSQKNENGPYLFAFPLPYSGMVIVYEEER